MQFRGPWHHSDDRQYFYCITPTYYGYLVKVEQRESLECEKAGDSRDKTQLIMAGKRSEVEVSQNISFQLPSI